MVYYDDIEVANALGSKAGVHKLGMFLLIPCVDMYNSYTQYSIVVISVLLCRDFLLRLGNIRPIYRSSLRAIQLISVARTADIRRYDFNALLQPFID